MITCVVHYTIDPAQIGAFERFAREWMRLVAEHGGIHHGYFLPAEGAKVVLSGRLDEFRDQPSVRISILDNGPGLNPEQRARIFEPFFTTKARGTGLGLAIARRIMEAHGGEIAVGDAATGTEIVLWLPLSRS